MTEEKIIKELKGLDLDKEEIMAFLNNLDIDLEKIDCIDELEFIQYDWGEKQYRCWINTKKSSYQYYFSVKARPILSNNVNIALGKFADYLGEKIFKNAFYDFEDMKVYFTVDNPNDYQINLRIDSVITLLDAFLWMKEFLIKMLENNHCDWEKEHQKRWNEYTEYLEPIFKVIDSIYNLEEVYTLEYEG